MSMVTLEANSEISVLAKQLWALGDPVRLKIIQILPVEPTCHNACNVSKIAERIGLSQPAASHICDSPSGRNRARKSVVT